MSMKAQDVATVCALVLLCRLSGVPCPPRFCVFWCVNPFSLDQYVDGLTRDCSDPLVSFVHETVLGSDRGWVTGVRNSSFVVRTLVQCVVEVFFFERTETNSFSVGDCWC